MMTLGWSYPTMPTQAPPGPPAARRRFYIRYRTLDALAALPCVSPTVGELAAAVGMSAADLAEPLAAMVRGDSVETWEDPDRGGLQVVMLSAKSVAKLGLVLSRRGDRWEYPDGTRHPMPRRDPGRSAVSMPAAGPPAEVVPAEASETAAAPAVVAAIGPAPKPPGRGRRPRMADGQSFFSWMTLVD